MVYREKAKVVPPKVSYSIKIDAELKKDMEQVCADLGLSMAAAITIYLKKVVKEKRIPFELAVDPCCSDGDTAHLRQGVEESNSGLGTERKPKKAV